jgi:orotate phosphoribosyltransferase
MDSYRKQFVSFSAECQALRFGHFVTKAGRDSPYFFDAGLFNDGARLARLTELYASAILDSGIRFDMLYGPAYKGIPLVAGVAIALAGRGHNYPYAFNRKEMKDHGEGGSIIGAPLKGAVLIVDDVISAGTSVRESLTHIAAGGASAAGVVIALDRMERGTGAMSAVDEVRKQMGLPVVSIANLDDIVEYLAGDPAMAASLEAVEQYRVQYGSR